MKRGNKGYTLVELVVAMAILSIVSVSGFSIIGYLNGTKAKSMAYNIQSGLGKARIETMSKSRGKQFQDVHFTIKLENGKYYMVLDSKGNEAEELIGNSNIDIYAWHSNNNGTPDVYMGTKNTGEERKKRKYNDSGIKDVDEIQFYFDRSTGGFTKGVTLSQDSQYETIQIVQGAEPFKVTTYQINITPITGKVSLERVF